MLNLNSITRTDINGIDWQDAPTSFDQTWRLYDIQEAEINGAEGTIIQLLLGYDMDSRKSSIAAEINGQWFDTACTQDWPVFDRLFGRAAWQALAARHQADAIAELDASDAD